MWSKEMLGRLKQSQDVKWGGRNNEKWQETKMWMFTSVCRHN